jgi:hypothetical protein
MESNFQACRDLSVKSLNWKDIFFPGSNGFAERSLGVKIIDNFADSRCARNARRVFQW